MSTVAEEIETLDWYGLYRDGWGDQLTPAAFAHPAKFAYGLITRIIRFGLERGYWRKNDLLGDPFAGVCCGGVIAAYNGLRWRGVELESRFIDLANGFECDDWLWPNEKAKCGARDLHESHHVQGMLELHRPRLEALGCPVPVVVQGDSRRFAELVAADAVVTSPPFVAQMNEGGAGKTNVYRKWCEQNGRNPNAPNAQTQNMSRQWGDSDGQIGSLKTGSLDACLTSPPYAESIQGTHAERETAAESWRARGDMGQGGSLGQSQRHGGYGETNGQIGAMPEGVLDAAVTSPPFSDSGTNDSRPYGGIAERGQQGGTIGKTCGASDGQIGNLSDGELLDAAVTSPPWQQNCEGGVRADKFADPAAFAEKMSERPTNGTFHQATPEVRKRQFERDNQKVYGDSPGQIGQLKGGTLLDASVTSPPYISGGNHDDVFGSWNKNGGGQACASHAHSKDESGYGTSEGQIGKERETYWSAMRDVWRQVWLSLKPNGVLCVVVKSYVRDGEVIDLPGQTMQLLEACGFKVFLLCRAWLTEEQSHPSLFDDEPIVKTTARKSFFRRLYEKKYPENSIDFECVIWARKESP